MESTTKSAELHKTKYFFHSYIAEVRDYFDPGKTSFLFKKKIVFYSRSLTPFLLERTKETAF